MGLISSLTGDEILDEFLGVAVGELFRGVFHEIRRYGIKKAFDLSFSRYFKASNRVDGDSRAVWGILHR